MILRLDYHDFFIRHCDEHLLCSGSAAYSPSDFDYGIRIFILDRNLGAGFIPDKLNCGSILSYDATNSSGRNSDDFNRKIFPLKLFRSCPASE